MPDIERWECGRCGTAVREGRRTHYCGEGYTLKVTDDIRRVRYVRADQAAGEGAVDLLARALPYLRDLDEMLDGQGPGLLARSIEAHLDHQRSGGGQS